MLCLSSIEAQTKMEIISAGSYIIDMGQMPQTEGNALKPYGLIYDLLKNDQIPIKWIINPDKTKDGIDFSSSISDYKGGPFIIPLEFRSPDIDLKVSQWQGQGVVIDMLPSDQLLPVALTLSTHMFWTLDQDNGDIAEEYLNNAGIPETAYNWEQPDHLGKCNTIFVLPHADPEWSSHGNLLDWVKSDRGSLWASCHAVSVMENLSNPTDQTEQLNFLSYRH